MKLNVALEEIEVHHDITGSFGVLLRDALNGKRVAVGLGPIYAADTAIDILLPFQRSARETGWDTGDELVLAPDFILERARASRAVAVIEQITQAKLLDLDIINEWTRAGLVLEVARRHGIHYRARTPIHVPWKLNGTVTGRFGTEPVRGVGWTFNPLSLSEEDRRAIRPSASERHIAVMDFRAMDLCSMTSLVPGLAEKYGDHYDLHQRTAELLLPNEPITPAIRDIFKKNMWVYAYGGSVEPAIRDLYDRRLPEIKLWFGSMPHGDGARKIQSLSSVAFRAGLSKALPLLVGFNTVPMFTVHDELTLDVSEVGLDQLVGVSKALEEGASQRIGRPYRVGTKTGYTYEEAKKGHL